MHHTDPQAQEFRGTCGMLAVNPAIGRYLRESLGRYADRLGKHNTSAEDDLEALAHVEAARRYLATAPAVGPRCSPAPVKEKSPLLPADPLPAESHTPPWLIVSFFALLALALLSGRFALDFALHRRADPELTFTDWVFSRRQQPTSAATAGDTEMIEVADWYIEMGGFARFMFNLGIATFLLVGCAVSWFIIGWLTAKWESRHPG